MKSLRAIGVAVGLGWLAGCATPPPQKATGPIFYPPSPAEPRLQFLVSFSNEQDLGGGPSKFATYITGKPTARHPILKPYGLALQSNQLFVCDTGLSGIDILDLQKKTFRYFTPTREGQLYTPVNIALDADGTRYVADSARGQVLIFGADDKYRGAIGEKVGGPPTRSHMVSTPAATPPEPAEPPPDGVARMKPTDVLLAGERLYVADMKGQCVRVYDKANRQELFTIPRDPAAADKASKLYSPVNLALDPQGRLYVCDIGAFRVQQFGSDGQYLRSFGSGIGDRPGEFARPKGIAVDRQGRLFVVDAAAQVVQIFDAEGKLLMYFGEPGGSEAPLDLPAKVVLDYDHLDLFQKYAAPDFQLEYLVLVTNQYGSRKISIYGFGHKR